MKRFLAFLCVLAMALGVVNPAVFAAEISDVQAVIDAGAEEIIVLEADAFNITIDRDTTIDLNGHSIDGVTVLAGTLYCMDSQTADYTVADGVYGHVTNVTGSVKAAPGYLQVGDSFHAVNLDIYAMTLRAADVGVYYKSKFAADEVVAAQVESFGVALSVVTAPNASNLETYCGYSQFTGFEAGEGANSASSSTLLKNIMKAANGDEKNAKNAAMPVYGRAYIKTSEGYVFGETVKRSLQEQVEAIDGVWETLSDAQKAPVLSMLESYTAVMENWEITNIQGIQAPGADEEIEIPIEVTAENGVVTEAVTVEQDEISITVPAGTKLAEGVSQLTLTVTPKETSEAGLTLEKSEVLMPMDVHVDGLAADNAQPLTIYLGKVMAENLNMGNYTVYHVENGKANEMVLIPATAEFTAHNQYKYTLDGELTLYMASFSEVAVVSDVNNTWEGNRDYTWYNTTDKVLYIRNADQLAAFSAIVGDMAFKEVEVQVGNYTLIDIEPIVEEDSFAGKTVVLLADIDLGDKDDASEHIFYPIGYGNANMSYVKPSDGTATGTYMQAFEGTFDGNGNTISNFYQNTWQMWGNYDGNSYNSAMGLFAYINGGTVKNLTVDNFSSDGEFAPTGVIAAYAANAAFENIAITNCNPRVYNTGNGGIVGIGGLSTDSEKAQMTFQNITIDNTNKITALWGSWDVACGGLIGMFRGAGHVYMDNCHVAAQIDVYNDVCGNYQYYWYRYAGMLIGTNKTMVTDANGYTVPETTKFHAEGCTVHFGTWNDYYYCELVENSLASYTHDHQFSRLTLIDSLAEIQDEAGNWNKTGNFMIVSENKCYHVRKDENGFYLHSHDDYNRDGTDDYETVNGESILVENNRCVYLPFNQLFTGYGWGVKHIPLGEFNGVTILPRETADSVVKFDGLVENGTKYATGSSFAIGNLFAAKEQNDAAIVGENVQVTVSPADKDSTVSGIYTANTDDWTKGTLKLSGTGAAVITITDYYFCQATTITVNVQSTVAKIGEVEYTSLQDAMDAVANGGKVDLQASVTIQDYLDIYTANNGEVERAITLNLNGHTIAPAADYKYEWYPLVFVGINQSLTIENGTIVSDEHTAIGVYGSLKLEGVVIERTVTADAEESVCIWNWGEDDDYYQDCQYLLTGSATISGGSIEGGVLVEGPVELKPGTEIDKLYLNTKTGRGKFILPDGYGLVKENGYYTNLHEHNKNGENGACSVCGLAFSYVATDLANIESTDIVVITMTTSNGTVYALSNDKGTSAAPTAIEITVGDDAISGEVAENIKWNISKDNDSLTIYPNGVSNEHLYCRNDNNGVRVGNTSDSGDNNQFSINNAYLYNNAQTRYVGVYTTNPDWRCYTSINSNIKDQTLTFYVLKSNCDHEENSVEDREEIAPTCKEAGRKAGKYCLKCDTYISGGELIDATGHDFMEKSNTATCDQGGRKTSYCTVCNKVKTEKSAATGHSYESVVTVEPGCETVGTQTYTCSVCHDTYSEEITATGHSYQDGICEICGQEDPDAAVEYTITFKVNNATVKILTQKKDTTIDLTTVEATEVEGYTFIGWAAETVANSETSTALANNYTVEADATLYALYSYVEGTGTGGYTLVKDATTLAVGDKIVIAANDANHALSTNQKSNNRGAATITKTGETITFGDDVQILTLEEGTTSGTYALYTGSGYLYAASDSGNYLKTQSKNDANGSWKIEINGNSASIVAQGSYSRKVMQYNPNNGSPLFACYASASQKAISIYKETSGEKTYYTTAVCTHENTTEVTSDATCTAEGAITVKCDDCDKIINQTVIAALGHEYDSGKVTTPASCTASGVMTYTCANCDDSYTEEIAATGHNFVDGICSACGEPEATEPSEPVTKTLNVYGTTGTKTSDSSSISWTSEAVTFTNKKGSTAIRTSDSNHYRLYSGSAATVSVASGKITKVVFTCTSSDYANVLKTSLTKAGYTATVSGSVVTVTLSENVSEVTFTLSAQSRINKIEVTYIEE